MKKEHYSWMAITSFILPFFTFAFVIIVSSLFESISSIVVFISRFLFILAILLGIFGLIKIKKNNELEGKALAWLGIILSFLGMILLYYFLMPIY